MFITDVRHYTRPNTTNCWPRPAPQDAPLYAPAVGTGTIEVLHAKLLDKFGADDRSTREIAAIMQWLNDPTLHEAADVDVGDSTAMPGDTETLVANGLLREPLSEDSPVTVRAQMRTEQKGLKFRRRTVFHTHAANDGADTFTKSMMRVNPIQTLKRMARRNKYGATRDFTSFFHQMLLALKVGERYIVRINGKKYALTRAAMGHKASAAAAHSITRAVARLACNGEAEYDVIIDDVAFFGNGDETLERVVARFDAICEEAGLTIGAKTQPSTQVSHRGIDFDLANHTVRVRATTMTRTIERVNVYQKNPTKARARSLLGAAVATAQVVPVPVCYFMKQVARYMNGGPPADFAPLADLIINSADNIPTAYDDVPYAGAVVADATPTSYGGVYVDQHGNVYHTAGTFAPGQFASVNEAEAWATILTLQLVPDRKHWSRIDVYTDNQVWCGAMGRQWAKAERIDLLRQHLTRQLTQKRLVAGNTWVRSEDNPTDNISRQRDWSDEDTGKLRQLLGMYAVSVG